MTMLMPTQTKDHNDGLTSMQRLSKMHYQIMQHPSFCLYSGIISMGEVRIEEGLPTAGTDGRNVYYGDAFVRSLTDHELRFLILHETLHKAFRHMTTWRALYDEDPALANQACDYVINLALVDEDKAGTFIKMPASGLIDERFRGMDSGRVFRELKKEQDEGAGDKGDDGDDGDGDDQGEDQGDGKCEGNSTGAGGKQGQGKGKGDNGKPGKGQGGSGGGKPGGFDQHDWDKAKELSKEEVEALHDAVDVALRQGAALVGKLKGNVPRAITEILKPKVDWREVMREFIKSTVKGTDDTTWSKLDRRRMGQGLYLPSTISHAVGRIVCAPDVSGSVGTELMNQFISEVKSIVEEVSPEFLDVLYWDASVQTHETYDRVSGETYTQRTKVRGGGGTNPDVVPKYMVSNAKDFSGLQCVVMLTDGYVPGWGDWDGVLDETGQTVPVLWVICGDSRAVPTYGQVVWVE